MVPCVLNETANCSVDSKPLHDQETSGHSVQDKLTGQTVKLKHVMHTVGVCIETCCHVRLS